VGGEVSFPGARFPLPFPGPVAAAWHPQGAGLPFVFGWTRIYFVHNEKTRPRLIYSGPHGHKVPVLQSRARSSGLAGFRRNDSRLDFFAFRGGAGQGGL